LNLSNKLAKYISKTKYDDLPQDVVEFTKLCVLDYFSSAIAGSYKDPINKFEEVIYQLGGDQHATLMTGGKATVTQAAFLNGGAGHVVEQDDIHRSSIIHAGTVVIPAALAVSEWKKLSGKDFITAIVVGYEVCYRIGEAVSPSHYYYWHNTSTCGTFGAAAAVAKLLQLNEQQIVYTLGSAGTQAAGLWEFIEDGAMSKQLHTGKSALNGVLSALLSEKNLTSAEKILEGDRGFFKAMSNEYVGTNITHNLGDQYKILENSFKIHASCRHTHHAMDLMIELIQDEEIDTDEVSSITVKTYQVAIDITDNNEPTTQYESKFSLQFCTALAFIKGEGGVDAFSEETLWNCEIRRLMKKINVTVDPNIEYQYPEKWGAIVEIKKESGQTITMETEYPRGDPENPILKKELISKFHLLANDWSKSERKSMVDIIFHLEKVKTMNEIFMI